MEANREESLQCLEKAKREYLLFQKNKNAKDHFENSHRLAKKSERMFPSTQAKELIRQLESCASSKKNNSSCNGARSRSPPVPQYGNNTSQTYYHTSYYIRLNIKYTYYSIIHLIC